LTLLVRIPLADRLFITSSNQQHKACCLATYLEAKAAALQSHFASC
jgi:hypothetical protein